MAKVKTAFVCSDCGSDYSKWQGQCSDCGAWNTLQEIRLSSAKAASGKTAARSGYAGASAAVQRLSEVSVEDLPRVHSGYKELDRVLGGGIVPGSAVLIGGHPGAGKSTLLLQVMCYLASQQGCLYVTGEESVQQVAMRANRLGLPSDQLQILSETSVESILATAETIKPKVLVIDSIQVVHLEDISSAPGSVSQVRESAAVLTRFAKQTGTVVVLVGHVTKDGSLAGPKVLEHMIDASILLEGGHDSRYRTLRGQKNRFGAVNELGVFAMTETGLKEVSNPSAIFLQRGEHASGSVVTVIWEGTRPLLVELQSLVSETQGAHPKRVAVGLDQNRMGMLLAVLHRHAGLLIGDQDVYANIVGGVKVSETGADLALLLAIVSSFRDRRLPQDLVVFGEVGLSGEIRPVTSGMERVREAAKHGFKKAIVPVANAPKEVTPGFEVIAVKTLQEALNAIE